MSDRRISLSKLPSDVAWADAVAREVIKAFPDEEVYTCAAGISPSGIVHFGNFRDVITSHAVRRALESKGKRARLIFSWDNFDRLRRIPAGVPESFAEHIGKPLSKIPDPSSEFASYAERFQAPFEEAMRQLGLSIEYRNQTALYEAGTYDEMIFRALGKRLEIADILLSFMTEKAKGEKGIEPASYREAYYPISVYSRFTGKDNTKVLSYDGGTGITYYCADSRQTETVDLSKEHIAKLSWKVDWPMRWTFERVAFEPGGHDHASPGSSFDVGSVMVKKIFDREPPVFVEYKFVGIRGLGSKMSGSKGNAVSPLKLLEIYDPELLKWLYLRKSPDQSFELSFDSEIYRQYDEYDSEISGNAIPFRQAVGFGQVVQWNAGKLTEMLSGLGLSYSPESIALRLPRAEAWLSTYNPHERIELLPKANEAYVRAMSDEQKENVRKLHDALRAMESLDVRELETLVYAIPKKPEFDEAELKKAQRAFFKDVYMLLIGRETGPRLSTFLWAVDTKRILNLLAF